MINEIKGDLLTARGLIVHGTNAQGVMGSGVALQIKNKWPTAFDVYKEMFAFSRDVPRSHYLGMISIATIENSVTGHGPGLGIVNMITQEFYGKDGGKYVKYDAIDKGFETLAAAITRTGTFSTPVNFPLIGCGLAGGHWPVVREIIEHRMDDRFTKVLWTL